MAVSAIRTINTAQIQYAKIHPEKGFASSLRELGPVPGSALIDGDLANGRKYSYAITLNPTYPNDGGPIVKYTLAARPDPYGNRGKRSFFSDECHPLHCGRPSPHCSRSCSPILTTPDLKVP